MKQHVKALNWVKRTAKFWRAESGLIGGFLLAVVTVAAGIFLIMASGFILGVFVWMD